MSEEADSRSTLLYIEDDVANIRLMERIVKLRPTWELFHAGDGTTGVELAREKHPTLIFLDLGLPKTNGIDVQRQIRAEPEISPIPIVIVSGGMPPPHLDNSHDAFTYFLRKPFEIEDILNLLDRYDTVRP